MNDAIWSMTVHEAIAGMFYVLLRERGKSAEEAYVLTRGLSLYPNEDVSEKMENTYQDIVRLLGEQDNQ